MLILYDYVRSSASYRVRIALNYKNIPYKCQPIHLLKKGGEQHHPHYQTINPQALVPSLQDGDIVITQSMAILEYLEETYPEPNLLPHDPIKRSEVRALANIITCDTHPLNNLRVLQYLKNRLFISESEKIQWYHHWLHKSFAAIETKLRKNGAGPFCFGNQASFADVCLIPQVYNAHRFQCDMGDYALIEAIYQNCQNEPAFAKASPALVKQ